MKTEMMSYCLYNRVFAEITTPIMKGAIFEDIAENMLRLSLLYFSAHKNNSKRQSINGKEFDTYKVGTVANSCSTMHKIADKEFTIEDFSHEHLLNMANNDASDALFLNTANSIRVDGEGLFCLTINVLNYYRERYIKTKDKRYWWQLIQLLPSSYNQKRTVMLNYEVLANMYHSRKNHKLDEWREFCKWIESLPYSELITGEEQK